MEKLSTYGDLGARSRDGAMALLLASRHRSADQEALEIIRHAEESIRRARMEADAPNLGRQALLGKAGPESFNPELPAAA